MWLLFKEEFEDTKGVIRIRISKKNRQHNGQKKKDKQRSIKHTHKRANKIYVLLFIAHVISFNPRTTHQTSQSQTMQDWTHLRPRSPLHTSLDLLNALHLNHGHSRASPALWKGGGLLHLLWQKFYLRIIFASFQLSCQPQMTPPPPLTHLPIHF